jgi:hypothetical protein
MQWLNNRENSPYNTFGRESHNILSVTLCTYSIISEKVSSKYKLFINHDAIWCYLSPLAFLKIKNIVACRPVARQRPRKKQLYNSCCWITASQTSMPARQQLERAAEERCFLYSPCRDVISRRVSEAEAGSNTSNVALRIVGGDGKRT